MKQNLKKLFPDWVNNIDNNNKLILTNDLDSLFTVALLKKMFGCQVGMFYDFDAIYSTQNKFNKENVIGCDLAIEDKDTKTFCNHVTKMWEDDEVNPLSANLNNIAGIYGGKYLSNYFHKYNGSTALTVLSLYEVFNQLLLDGCKELTETQKMILVSIDSYFYGAYHPKCYEANEYFYKWQQSLGLDMFQDIFDRYTKQDLIDFQTEHSLKGEIYIDGNTLSTTLDIGFLQEHFPMLDFSMDEEYIKECRFNESKYQHYYTRESKHDIAGHVFSLSVINRDTISYTTFL